MTYCPNCGAEQKQNIYGKHSSSEFAWTYDFTCEKCNRIISYDDWGYDYSKEVEE